MAGGFASRKPTVIYRFEVPAFRQTLRTLGLMGFTESGLAMVLACRISKVRESFREANPMSVVTLSLSDSIAATLQSRAEAAGLSSTEEYLLALVRADCEEAELESLLETRLDGPFASLETEWKQEVRAAAERRG